MEHILVIGGSYFAGRIFTMAALQAGCRLTLINRGKYSLKELGNVTEYICDRHDDKLLKSLPLQERYDAVVDFCAYRPGDIEKIFECLPCSFQKYIYISTADVCEGSAGVRDECSKLQGQMPSDPAGRYTYHKMLLELELQNAAQRYGCPYTILRPVFIYGPYNYAPRESWYIRQIIMGTPVPVPVNATGRFQMVYVKDVARGILLCIKDHRADNGIYILSAPEIMDYQSYMKLLEEAGGRRFETVPVTVEEGVRRKLPLPFPLWEQENELFCGEKIVSALGFQYGDQKKYMKLTFDAFSKVFKKN